MGSMNETNLAYHPGDHALHGTWLSVDVVAFTDHPDESRVVLIRRNGTPHEGSITLPGGLLAAWAEETVPEAAARILKEKSGAELVAGTIPIDVVSDRRRDDRGHTVSIVVAGLVKASTLPEGIPGAARISDIPGRMPFGHTEMVRKARAAIDHRLLVDPELTRTVLGDVTTSRTAISLLRACSSDVTLSAFRGRWARCGMYRAEDQTDPDGHTRGRPVFTYRWRD